MMIVRVRKSGDPDFTSLLKALASGRFSRDVRFPLKSTSSGTTACGWLCRSFSTEEKEYIRLDLLIIFSTNELVD